MTQGVLSSLLHVLLLVLSSVSSSSVSTTAKQVRRNNRDLSICDGKDDTQPAICYADDFPQAYNRSRPVLRVWVKFEQYLLSHCTAWLLGSDGHVMTNMHCVESQEMADSLVFEAYAERGSCDVPCDDAFQECEGVKIDEPLTFVATGSNDSFDYSLLQLPESYRYLVDDLGYLQFRPTGPRVGEEVYVPQHPLGRDKRIAVETKNGTQSCQCHPLQRLRRIPRHAQCRHGVGSIGRSRR